MFNKVESVELVEKNAVKSTGGPFTLINDNYYKT